MLALLLLGGGQWSTELAAQEAPATPRFRQILEQRLKETLHAVARYVEQHPEADDVEAACQWLWETAAAQGLEAEVITAAQSYLQRPQRDAASSLAAQQVLSLGLAKTGKLPAAVETFEAYLRGVRFQPPQRTLDFAHALSAQARLAGNLPAGRAIYERVLGAYPLNAAITEIIEGRLSKLELQGKPAPHFAAEDITGKPFDLADYKGQVVLVDFWATNCAPCLAEIPNLRQIYKDLQPQGFEIIGVSFDDNPQTVSNFAERAKLPWRMLMNDALDTKISPRYNVRTIPSLFLVNRAGEIAQVDIRGSDLRPVIERLLRDAKPEK